MLPPSALETLMNDSELVFPLYFGDGWGALPSLRLFQGEAYVLRIRFVEVTCRTTHRHAFVGVLEFTADDGVCDCLSSMTRHDCLPVVFW
jgi:hypothetical protein